MTYKRHQHYLEELVFKAVKLIGV